MTVQFNFIEYAEAENHLDCYETHTSYATIVLRRNASEKAIESAQAELRRRSKVLLQKGMDANTYLKIGDVVRWGVRGEAEAWGDKKDMVKRELAGQGAYADSL
jgi:hypothetical protein